MAQDTTPAIVIYRGNGDNSVPYDVPFDKGYYGEVKVAFVRRGLDDYTYEPDTYTVNGRLYAWSSGSGYIYTHTPNPAVGAETYNNVDEDTGETVTAIAGQTITVDGIIYTRAVQHDIANQLLLYWTGTVLTSDDFICIVRDTERGQPYTFPNNQKHIEGALDNIERQVQENKDKLDNALIVDPSHTTDTSKMNPIDWMKSIIRCVDFSVRALRYANGWLDYSLDDPNKADADKTWTHVLNTDNVKRLYDVVTIDPDTSEEIRTLYYEDSDGNSHKIFTSINLDDLTDVSITNPQHGEFMMYDGARWINTVSSGTVGWGAILGNITDQTDLMNKFTEYVRTDGSSTMTGVLKMRASVSFECAVAPYWHGVGLYKLNDNDSVTLLASMEATDGWEPGANNTYNMGTATKKWKNLYLSGKAFVSTINNGFDIAVPVTNSADTLALKSQVDDAANSGEQLYTTGVWFAKMYSASVVPTGAEYDGKNYADFSQVDNDNNPIVVIYEGQSGSWVEIARITPPANHVAYLTITSKIWDIAEQTDQQGGEVLWSYNQKTFTSYPKIVRLLNQANTDLSNLTATGEARFTGKANTDLDNLTATGKANIALYGDMPGMLKIWAGSTVPNGYLLCDGSAVSRTTYADLFAAIGTTYGAGDGSTTFNLPTQSVIPLGTSAPVYGDGKPLATAAFNSSTQAIETYAVTTTQYSSNSVYRLKIDNFNSEKTFGVATKNQTFYPSGGYHPGEKVQSVGSGLYADLASSTGATAKVIIKY